VEGRSDVDDVVTTSSVLLLLAVDMALLVGAMAILKWLVARWVRAQPAEPLG
jgi:hypothetical protein